MFFGEGKIGPMREMILAETAEQRRAALAKLLPLQRADFAGIFRGMARAAGHHPHCSIRRCTSSCRTTPRARRSSRPQMGIPAERVHARVEALHEFNPMLGFRGCRLGIVYPEITEMQARAIFEAAASVQREGIEGRTRRS